MPASLRLTTQEQKKIQAKRAEINQFLALHGHEPIRDSDLAHFVLTKAIEEVSITKMAL